MVCAFTSFPGRQVEPRPTVGGPLEIEVLRKAIGLDVREQRQLVGAFADEGEGLFEGFPPLGLVGGGAGLLDQRRARVDEELDAAIN